MTDTKMTPREPPPEMVEAENLTVKKPTIAELEAMLNDPRPHEVYMLPNGEIRARPLSELPDADDPVKAPRWRHVKRGTVYAEIGRAELQGSATEGELLVVYQGDDGKLWARPHTEFHDGRFMPASPTKTGGTP